MNIKTCLILQARMGSSRLKGKTLLPVGTYSILEMILERTRQADVDEFWIATTTAKEDDVIEQVAIKRGINCYRGSTNDVYSRFDAIISKSGCNTAIRLTADNPLIGYDSINYLKETFVKNSSPEITYLSDFDSKNFPIGSFGEIFLASALLKCKNNMLDYHKSHVTLKLRENLKNEISIPHNSSFPFAPGWRWTIDYQEDYEWLCNLNNTLDNNLINYNYCELVEFLNLNKKLIRLDSVELSKPLQDG